MPVPKPRSGEKQDAFLERCHRAMADEFDDSAQRHAVCMSAWRKKHGGKAPKDNATPMVSVFTVTQGIDVRTEMLDGVEHQVLPMVAMVEGVYRCANCEHDNYYSAAEFGKQPGAWNGRPVTISHPTRNGTFVSAGSPDVFGQERIGTVFNAHLDGDKLRAEAWVDPKMVERAGKDAKAVMAAIEDGDDIEVSTAAWIDELPRFGSHKGRQFKAVQTNFQPDHIAILKIGEIGACNWADGCGIRVASAKLEPCCDDCAAGEPCGCADAPDVELQSAKSLEQALMIALEREYGVFSMVVDWDDSFVYFVAEGRRGLRRRAYDQDDDGRVTLSADEDGQVRQRADYVVVNHDQEDGMMPETKDPAAAAGQQPPKDAPKQTGQPKAGDQPEQPPQQNAAPPLSAADRTVAALQAQVEFLTDKLAKLEKPAAQTPEEYIEQAPPQIRHMMMSIYRQQEKHRLELVDMVAGARGNLYPKEELDAMPIDQLEKLASLAARTDYSVQPPAQRRASVDLDDDADFMAIPPSIFDTPSRAS